MASRLERALEAGLRIRPGEQRRVALMAAYAASAVGAVVVGRSLRDALFLANVPRERLAGMYVWSSLAIVLVSYGYARIADKVRRGTLNSACAAISAVLCAAFWAAFNLGGGGTFIYYALYIFVEAMGSLVVILTVYLSSAASLAMAEMFCLCLLSGSFRVRQIEWTTSSAVTGEPS